MNRIASLLFWLGPVLIAGIGCSGPRQQTPAASADVRSTEASFVGGDSCTRCHENEARLWQGAHHDLAMQVADERTVLGDFDDATYTYNGVTSTFFRRDGKFFVKTDGPDGELQDYEIAYTFGATPLQQYLIAFPEGRYQALSICWDTRSADDGGQRWFHLYPDEPIDHKDPLHWTAHQQTWNFMCAECHSTDLKKGYQVDREIYETTFAEINVSCEACHGPGSRHVAWANARDISEGQAYEEEHMGLVVRLTDPGRGTWLVSPETSSGFRMAPPVETAELATCARCHSRRGAFSEDYVFSRPIGDTHRVALLDEGLYHADGQILEEVYVYGSFLQSKMYGKGVTCVDCHDAHSGQLHFPGDAVCFRCHSQGAFASRDHHFHKPGTEGAACVDCHMPPKNYMVVDPRHDHSLRVPRPDLSQEIGTPNACNDCHADKTVAWSVGWIEKWYGAERRDEWHYGQALHAGRQGLAEAERELLRVIEDAEMPPIARASALTLLPAMPSTAAAQAIERALSDADPLLRRAALTAVESLALERRPRLVSPLLSDPVAAVRLEAVRLLAGMPLDGLTVQQRTIFEGTVDEYKAAQLVNADRPEGWLNLGLIDGHLGRLSEAESSYRKAIEVDPAFLPAVVNLADLYRAQGRDAEGEMVLRQALEMHPTSAELHHSLGLLLVRGRQIEAALSELKMAAELQPAEPRFAYVYAVALYDSGDPVGAMSLLEETHRRFPGDREVLIALVSFYRQAEEPDRALAYARKLLELAPQDPSVLQMIQQLEAIAG